MLSQGPSRDDIPDDAVLLERVRQGDPEAWLAVAAKFRPPLRDLAAATLPAEIASRTDASDIVQQTFAEAHAAFAAFDGSSLPELYAWLAAILNNNVNDAVRRHVLAQGRSVKAESHLDDSSGAGWGGVCAADQTSPSMAAARGEQQEQLRVALDSLPPRQREAVRLRHLEARPLAEIAAQLGCTTQAAAAVIARGLRALRDSLHHSD